MTDVFSDFFGLHCHAEPFCRCCVCQGKHCLRNHPGHSHREWRFTFSDGVTVSGDGEMSGHGSVIRVKTPERFR